MNLDLAYSKITKSQPVGLIEYHVDKVRIRQLIIGIRRKIVLFKVVESLQKGATYITNIYIYIYIRFSVCSGSVSYFNYRNIEIDWVFVKFGPFVAFVILV